MKIENLWSTPLHRGTFDPTEILTWALANHDVGDPSLEIDHNIFDKPDEAVQNLKQLALGHFEEYLNEAFNLTYDDFNDIHIKGWIGGSRTDYQMQLHNHAKSQLSAIYYLVAADGQLILTDPRSNANRGYGQIFKQHFEHIKIDPAGGMFLLFPSYIWHYVKHSMNLRMCVPIDLFLSE